MKRHQVDFLRNIVTARDTKNGRPRDIPMNNDVRDTLAELCKDRRPDDYVFVSPKDSDERQREVAFEIHESQKVF
jgi:integrase